MKPEVGLETTLPNSSPQERQQEHLTHGLILFDSRYSVIGFEPLLYGNVDSAFLYRREIIKAALNADASAVITAHYPRDGNLNPDKTDIALIKGLEASLEAIHVRLVDHLIICGTDSVSFAEQGLLK